MQRVLAASRFVLGLKPSSLQVSLARGFSTQDPFKDRGSAAENEWARKENEKKLKNLKTKIEKDRSQGADEDDVSVESVLEDREYLVVEWGLTQKKFKQHKIENDALIKDLLKWKYGKY